jgi:hypothetical protein
MAGTPNKDDSSCSRVVNPDCRGTPIPARTIAFGHKYSTTISNCCGTIRNGRTEPASRQSFLQRFFSRIYFDRPGRPPMTTRKPLVFPTNTSACFNDKVTRGILSQKSSPVWPLGRIFPMGPRARLGPHRRYPHPKVRTITWRNLSDGAKGPFRPSSAISASKSPNHHLAKDRKAALIRAAALSSCARDLLPGAPASVSTARRV